MKKSMKELAVEEYRLAIEKHLAKVLVSKETEIKDLQRAGIVGKDGKFAEPYR